MDLRMLLDCSWVVVRHNSGLLKKWTTFVNVVQTLVTEAEAARWVNNDGR